MTSNIGSQFIMDVDNKEQREARVTEALRGHFRPEFLNRIDETIIFDRLSDANLNDIVRIQLQRVITRLARQNIHLDLAADALQFVADQGYDPVYGARPLKRAIQKHLLDPLSLAMLEGSFKEGDHIHGSLTEGKITFTKTAAAVPA
jgi:ATP-dependent Clp protease ATP-binding subunit ClpB